MSEEPKMHLSKRRNIGQTVILSTGFAMLLCISLASVWLVTRARDESAALQRNVRIENAVMQTGSYLRRAESAQRGYLLSENEGYLELFESGIQTSNQGAESLNASDFDNDEDRAALARLRDLARQKIKELRETVELQKYGARDEAMAAVKTNVGEQVMREIAMIVESMRDRLRKHTAERAVEARRSTMALLLVTLSSTVTIFALAFLSTRMSRRSTATIESARLALAEVNAHLEKRVTERTADLVDANNEIQSFAYIVSHDLRSPLVNIMGFTSELEALRDDVFTRLDAAAGPPDDARKQLAKDFAEAFGFIKASSSKMDRLINAILKLARTGRRKLAPAEVDVTALAKTIATTMQHQLQDRSAKIEVQKLPGIESDQLALEQIFTNLLDNAVKYLRKDVPGHIEVKGTETPGFVTFEVSDNGRGIEEKDLGRVFELFRRSGKQDQAGEGIGLSHVRGMVRRLGGTIALDSEFGRGTVVRLTMPRHIVVENDAQ
jgi:signal transduction histidine kinase